MDLVWSFRRAIGPLPRWRGLLWDDVEVFVVLADPIEQFGIGYALPGEPRRPRFLIRLRVINRGLDGHAPESRPLKAFDNAKGVTMRMAGIIEPRLLVHAYCVH